MRLTCLVLSLVVVVPGCGTSDTDNDEPGQVDAPAPPGTPDAPSEACVSLAGAWGISGACGADLCTIDQIDCAITSVTCMSGAASTSGSVTGNAFSYTGTNAQNIPTTCTGTVNGNSATGTCTALGVPCDFAGDRL